MRVLAITFVLLSSFHAFAEAPRIGSGVSGPYVECQLPDGTMEFTPTLICKNKGGVQI